jgi:hypothetical protein
MKNTETDHTKAYRKCENLPTQFSCYYYYKIKHKLQKYISLPAGATDCVASSECCGVANPPGHTLGEATGLDLREATGLDLRWLGPLKMSIKLPSGSLTFAALTRRQNSEKTAQNNCL